MKIGKTSITLFSNFFYVKLENENKLFSLEFKYYFKGRVNLTNFTLSSSLETKEIPNVFERYMHIARIECIENWIVLL